mmetsp:Transcript_133476/g.256845  ORF Transcript_133476/g.256845 Transcript_133476/m.256845 type:complete len:244 (-) Transcript_133476:2-733(-)
MLLPEHKLFIQWPVPAFLLHSLEVQIESPDSVLPVPAGLDRDILQLLQVLLQLLQCLDQLHLGLVRGSYRVAPFGCHVCLCGLKDILSVFSQPDPSVVELPPVIFHSLCHHNSVLGQLLVCALQRSPGSPQGTEIPREHSVGVALDRVRRKLVNSAVLIQPLTPSLSARFIILEAMGKGELVAQVGRSWTGNEILAQLHFRIFHCQDIAALPPCPSILLCRVHLILKLQMTSASRLGSLGKNA